MEIMIHKQKIFEKLSLEKKIDIALQIARGVAYIHYKNVIHGDLKPGRFPPIK